MTPNSYMKDEIQMHEAREARRIAALREISRLSIGCLCACEITKVIQTMERISVIAAMELIDAPLANRESANDEAERTAQR